MKFAVILIFLGAICTQTFAQKCSKSDASMSVGATSDAAFWKGIKGAQHVTEVTTDTNEEFVKGNPTVFMMYYTTWCGYSKQARKPFAGAASKLKGKVAFGAVDCDKNEELCRNDEHPVQGYPTFYLYKDGEYAEEYNSERSTNAFVEYLNDKM